MGTPCLPGLLHADDYVNAYFLYFDFTVVLAGRRPAPTMG